MQRSYQPLQPREVVVALKQMLGQLGDSTAQVGGRVGFRVHGAAGGAWSVDLGTPGGAWSELSTTGELDACETRVYAFSHAFAWMLLEPEGIPGLLLSGELVVEGERSRLARLAQLLQSLELESERQASVIPFSPSPVTHWSQDP